ncbi:hypothetical protein DNH61_08040 [Paenibacillus sambharensis]|uniref:Uncharacterized protein n=1 Tax=Paenibacillus sambharensis TaxID=1803190 RepID=A0A2W1L8E7_9BACL|nr:hypothetical protein DNH61_08040 [Paenibacillus sambharensis]
MTDTFRAYNISRRSTRQISHYLPEGNPSSSRVKPGLKRQLAPQRNNLVIGCRFAAQTVSSHCGSSCRLQTDALYIWERLVKPQSNCAAPGSQIGGPNTRLVNGE